MTSVFPMLVLFKNPAYFGDGNKIRRATQSPPFQGRSFPRKAKFCCCVSFPPCPQARTALPQSTPGPHGGGAVHGSYDGAGVGKDSTRSPSEKERNWGDAEVRQAYKPTWRKKSLQTQTMKKGGAFSFTECQKKSDSPFEKANLDISD